MELLTKEEINYLLGGNVLELNELVSPDINNTNSTPTCVCSYMNKSVITNSNSETGCRCLCM